MPCVSAELRSILPSCEGSYHARPAARLFLVKEGIRSVSASVFFEGQTRFDHVLQLESSKTLLQAQLSHWKDELKSVNKQKSNRERMNLRIGYKFGYWLSLPLQILVFVLLGQFWRSRLSMRGINLHRTRRSMWVHAWYTKLTRTTRTLY